MCSPLRVTECEEVGGKVIPGESGDGCCCCCCCCCICCCCCGWVRMAAAAPSPSPGPRASRASPPDGVVRIEGAME